ncbi:hypothetical protein POM88_013889 [Heracleum sosnowskyi]|uniref:Uncharacterized protein n=1 Tax=Heracleum sosnowskyi TaxID=360622 RepID=A0AAD8N4U7_9APIA|nr:hypothetical protein POM88_013889 [Heracleum sosnowskyi]
MVGFGKNLKVSLVVFFAPGMQAWLLALPLSKRGKESIWKDLESIVNLSPDEACCFLGDFSCVRNSREKVNCEYRLRDSLGFNSLIKDQNLFDIKFLNTDFTWFDSKGKKSKLDRFLTNLNWYESGEWVVKALGRKQSDHKAIILWVEEQDWGPKPFKVFNWWLQEDSLKKILDEFWASKGSQEKGNIQSLLKEVKLVMKSWGKNIKSDLDNKIQLLESELERQDQSLAASNMAQKIQQELEACYYKRDASLRQKARINWNLQGDRNTKFFHQSILRRRNKNNLRKLLWKGKWITNSRAIKDAFFEYFSSFFSPHPGKGLLKLGSILKKRLDVNEQTFLEKPFSPEELDLAISQSANDKAPGPDGMNMKALKFMWPNIKDSILHTLLDFAQNMDLLSQGALLLNCQIGKWPMKYLGVPIGVSHKKKVFWKPLIQKMDQKLASWKAQSLNEAGRLTLLKSVVESLPVYWLSIFKLPKGISKHMERLRRDFYWSHYKTTGSQNKKKMHLVAWEKICSPKKAGGLGLVSFETKNMALLSKWCSKWRLDRDRSWNKWMRYKYLCPKSSNVESFPEGSKKSDFIVSLADIQVNSPLRNDLSPKNFSWKLNNGYLVLFWEDTWFQGRALKDSFKSLYRISALKEVEVRIFYDLWECYEHQSEVFWTRNLRNCELEDMESLNKILENVRLSNSSDKLLWAVSGDTFTVKDGVKRIHDLFQHDLVQWSSFWNLKGVLLDQVCVVFVLHVRKQLTISSGNVCAQKIVGDQFWIGGVTPTKMLSIVYQKCGAQYIGILIPP